MGRLRAVLVTDCVPDGGQPVADRQIETLARLAGAAVEPRRGQLQGLGGPLLAVFGSAVDALEAAVALRRAVERHNRRGPALPVRVAVHAGELAEAGGQVLGAPIDVARRLCEGAAAGQVLASDVIRGLADPQRDRLELLPPPDDPALPTVYDVDWRRSAGPGPALPAALAVGGDLATFVGRDDEMARLRQAWERACRRGPVAVFVAGEPGVGKTRLAAELAALVQPQGGDVRYGRGEEEMAEPYQPFVEAIGDAWLDHGDGSAEVDAADTGRARRFEAAVDTVAAASLERPVLLVLDDLQWADRPTLLLLRHVVRALPGAPLLVVATYRDSDIDVAHPLLDAAAALARDAAADTIRLGGLDEDAVSALLADVAPDASPTLVRRLHHATGGNPFFLIEVVRHLADSGALARPGSTAGELTDTPEGVAAVIGQRVRALGAEAQATLRVAAVLGDELDVGLLVDVGGRAEDEVLSALEEATTARLLEPAGGISDRYRFGHALVRQALYSSVPAGRRLRLHWRAGAALEARAAGGRSVRSTELAYHFCASASVGDPGRAVEHARRAAAESLARSAPEEAGRVARLALAALEQLDRPDPVVRCDVLVDIARADAMGAAGDDGRTAALEAAAIARSLGDGARLARAALAYSDQFAAPGALDDRAVVLLEEAAEAIPSDEHAVRALLLARLSWLYFARSPEHCEALSAEAVELARRSGDDEALVVALYARHWVLGGPDQVDEHLRAADELDAIADRTGSIEARSDALALRLAGALRRGERDRAEDALANLEALAAQAPVPRLQWTPTAARAFLSLVDGRFDDAERLGGQAFSIGQESGQDAMATFLMQLLALRWEQGRMAELEPAMRSFSGPLATVPANRCARALVLSMVGARAEAREELDALGTDRFAAIPREGSWLAALCMAGDACVRIGATDHARVVVDLLTPYTNQLATVSVIVGAGPVAYYLGRLYHLLGEGRRACELQQVAVERAGALGAVPWVARAQVAWAAAAAAVDQAQAADLAGIALATATAIGMATTAAEATAVLDGLAPAEAAQPMSSTTSSVGSATPEVMPASEVVVPSRPTHGAGRLVAEGDFWTVALDDELVRVKDTKGMRYLAHLLRNPGREIHVLDLVGVVDHRLPAAVHSGAGASPPVLDPAAKSAYRQRLHDLAGELEEAEANNDIERVARAQQEIDALTDELASAVGLGGRDRRIGSPAERARQNVSRAVKAAVERIAPNAPKLGRHLVASLRTGTFCSYAPDPRAAVVWRDR